MIVYFPTGFNEAGVQTITLGYAQAWFSGDSPAGQAAAASGWSYTAFSGNKGHAGFEGNKGHVAMDSQG